MMLSHHPMSRLNTIYMPGTLLERRFLLVEASQKERHSKRLAELAVRFKRRHNNLVPCSNKPHLSNDPGTGRAVHCHRHHHQPSSLPLTSAARELAAASLHPPRCLWALPEAHHDYASGPESCFASAGLPGSGQAGCRRLEHCPSRTRACTLSD
eukprot:3177037-Rhodomonas_salina.1